MQPCFLSCSPLSWSMSESVPCMCWWTCDFAPQIGTSTHPSPTLLFSHMLSSPPPLVPPPCPCPSCLLPLTLVVKRSKPFLKKSKPSCSSCTSCLGWRHLDRPHCIADVKTRNIIGPHHTCLTLPLPTVPQSGLLKSWKGFWDVYRNIRFLLCTFSALFRLRLAHSPFFICPFWSRLYYHIRCDIPYPCCSHTQCCAPHNNSVKFLVFRHQLFIIYDATWFVASRTFVLFVLFPFSPSTYFCV